MERVKIQNEVHTILNGIDEQIEEMEKLPMFNSKEKAVLKIYYAEIRKIYVDKYYGNIDNTSKKN